MADFVASVSSRVKLNLIPSSHFRSPKRNLSQGSCKVVNFPHRRAHSIGLSFSKEGPYIKETSLRCSCLGSLVDPDGVTASELVAISDQLLLVASIALTYMAGILPVNRSNFSLANIFDDNVVPESAATSSVLRRMMIMLVRIMLGMQ